MKHYAVTQTPAFVLTTAMILANLTTLAPPTTAAPAHKGSLQKAWRTQLEWRALENAIDTAARDNHYHEDGDAELADPVAPRREDTDKVVNQHELAHVWKLPDSVEQTVDRVHEREKRTRRRRAAAQEQLLEAFDCTVPAGLRPVILAEPDCDPPTTRSGDQRNASYLLLQKVTAEAIKVRQCRHTATELAWHCWGPGHNTFLPEHSRFGIPGTMDIKECRRMWEKRDWTYWDSAANRWVRTALKINAVNHYAFQSMGKVGIDQYSNAECSGEAIWADGTQYKKETVSKTTAVRYGTIELIEVAAVITADGEVILSQQERVLKCSAESGSCKYPGEVLFWEPMDRHKLGGCSFRRARPHPVHGTDVELTDNDNEKVFVSTDGSMLRLAHRHPVYACGLPLISTNFQKLFLSDVNMDSLQTFNRSLDAREVSVTTYMNQQDGFLYGATREFLAEEAAAVLKQGCLADRATQALRYGALAAAQRSSLDSDTVALGNGTYATAAGEVWYEYRCRPVLATPVSDGQCYAAVRVMISNYDQYLYARARGTAPPKAAREVAALSMQSSKSNASDNTLPLFLDPITRRLTTIGIKRPCTEHFPPLYKTKSGEWLAAGAHHAVAAAPEVRNSQSPLVLPRLPEYDMEGGGIYEVGLILEQEELTAHPRRGTDIVGRLAVTAADRHFSPIARTFGIPIGQLLASAPAFLSPLSMLADFAWKVLDWWSRVSSLLVGSYMFWRVLQFVVGRFLRYFLGPMGWHMGLPALVMPRRLHPRQRLDAARAWFRRQRDTAYEFAARHHEEVRRRVLGDGQTNSPPPRDPGAKPKVPPVSPRPSLSGHSAETQPAYSSTAPVAAPRPHYDGLVHEPALVAAYHAPVEQIAIERARATSFMEVGEAPQPDREASAATLRLGGLGHP